MLDKLKKDRLKKIENDKTNSFDVINKNISQLSKLIKNSKIFQDLKEIKKETSKYSNKIYFNFNDNIDIYAKNLEKRLNDGYLKNISKKKILIPILDIYISYKKIQTRQYLFYFFRISYIPDKKKWCLNVKHDHDYVIDEVPLAFPNLDDFLINGEHNFFSSHEKLIEKFYNNLMNIVEDKNNNFDEPFRLIRKKIALL